MYARCGKGFNFAELVEPLKTQCSHYTIYSIETAPTEETGKRWQLNDEGARRQSAAGRDDLIVTNTERLTKEFSSAAGNLYPH